MSPLKSVRLVECPRDAMQGWKNIISTSRKVEYLNSLLQVGFYTLDCGSFVSAKVIPQMADTREVLPQLHLQDTNTKLLTIVANKRGADEALTFDEVSFLGFPFSISPTFQLRNTNSTLDDGIQSIEYMHIACIRKDKELVVYLSMAFGNPYGDIYNEEIVLQWADRIFGMDINVISLADTVGKANPDQISSALSTLIEHYPLKEVGIHLHSTPVNRELKLKAAIDTGCKRIDGALKGYGGCPMADDELVGNMNTEFIIAYLEEHGIDVPVNKAALSNSMEIAERIFLT